MEVDGLEGVRVADRKAVWDEGSDVGRRREDWVWGTFQAGPDIRAEVLGIIS